MLNVRILGPIEAWTETRRLELGGPRQVALFSLLVLHANRPSSTDALVESLWRSDRVATGKHRLQMAIARLRRTLEPTLGAGEPRLRTVSGGYVLALAPGELDAEAFEARIGDGLRALHAGEVERAAELLCDALALWRGPPLAEVAFEDFAQAEIRRLEELRLVAVEGRIDAELRQGNYAQLVSELEALTVQHPTRERLGGQLMLALYRSGRQAEALEVYQRTRRRLAEELGLEPGPALKQLQARILEQAPALDQTETASRTRPAAHAHPRARAGAGGTVLFPAALKIEIGEEAFVGRVDALTRLGQRYALADARREQFVLLCGEPGIGKTRLASEFALDAHRRGAIVLYGRSDAEPLVPYQPFIIAIEHYIAQCGNGEFTNELEHELRELGRLIPSLRRHMPTLLEPLPVEPELRRYRMFDAVTRVLAFVATDRTAVLILDDLHWADTATALLLRHTLEQLYSVRLLILGTFRDSEICRSKELEELVAVSRPERGFERISLSGLDSAETAAFFAARRGRDATDDFILQLRYATGGNPLFMEETLKSFAEREPLDGRDVPSQGALRGIEIPERVTAVIGQRLLRVSENTRHVLGVASVIGAEFDLGLLDALIELPEDQIISSLEQAQVAGLVREIKGDIDRFSFAHALVREVLREQQSDSRRRRRHLRIGEALEVIAETSAVNPAELAYHFFESRHSDRGAKAFRYSLEAGNRAAESLAYEEAGEHYKRALGALEMQASPDESRRCEVLLACGLVQLRQGNPQARVTFQEAADLARCHGSPEQLGRAALGFVSRYTEAGVVDDTGIALLREALDQLGDDPSALRAELIARLADSLHFAPQYEETLPLSHTAVVMAREVGDTHALVAALVSRHSALLHIAHLDERLTLGQELLDLAERVGERELEALGHHWRIYDLLEAAEVESAQAEHRALIELARELRQPLYDHFRVSWDVVWANNEGRIEEAKQLAEHSYELGKRAQARDAETVYWAQVVALARREHRLSDFVFTVRSAFEHNPALLAWRAVLPLAHLAAGNPQEAAEEFDWLAHDDFSRVPKDMFWFTCVCVLAETSALLHDTARARVLYQMLLPYKDRTVQVTRAACWGSCERFLGLLAAGTAQWDLAVSHFESAIAKNATGGLPGAASLVQRDYAEMLFARRADDDMHRATGLFREALQAAQRAGMSQLAAFVMTRIHAIERER
ncbi:MAG: AAA family ATPase [Solirubrobacterales bacterium]|nr:AAA family ATPase [Solirubrobacterales bacterium]